MWPGRGSRVAVAVRMVLRMVQAGVQRRGPRSMSLACQDEEGNKVKREGQNDTAGRMKNVVEG